VELKNIIDKLANFVARNGPEFEHMTKQKQKDNPKFSFLFCGEYFNYYQYRVTTEQAGKLPSTTDSEVLDEMCEIICLKLYNGKSCLQNRSAHKACRAAHTISQILSLPSWHSG